MSYNQKGNTKMNPKLENYNIDDLIAGFLSAELNDDEMNLFKDWVNSSESNKKYFLEKQEIWVAAVCLSKNENFNFNEAYQKFVDRTNRISDSKSKIKKLLWTGFGRVAAVVLLFLSIGVSGYLIGNRSSMLSSRICVETPNGSESKVILPDGTVLWLNSGSKIEYGSDFGLKNRDIHLYGEGYFEVKKNKTLPFTVNSYNNVAVKVLGTKFNFRNYGNETSAKVVLFEGKVALNIDNEKKYLMPNQQATIDKNCHSIAISNTISKHVKDWKDGILFFDEDCLADIVKVLERNYDVKIDIIDDSLNSFKFYGSFKKSDQNINSIMDALASTNKFKYKINGKNLILSVK